MFISREADHNAAGETMAPLVADERFRKPATERVLAFTFA
jgi:hypothetical protein